MITSERQAERVQKARVMARRRGVAAAVRRYFKRQGKAMPPWPRNTAPRPKEEEAEDLFGGAA
jgi:hypothetical protein